MVTNAEHAERQCVMKVCGTHADTVQNHVAMVSPSPRRKVDRAEAASARGGKPLSLLSGAFSAVGADLVTHWISNGPLANKISARPKGRLAFSIVRQKEVRDGGEPRVGGVMAKRADEKGKITSKRAAEWKVM